MISPEDHLESLEKLRHDASLQRVWPQVMETAGGWLRPGGRLKVLGVPTAPVTTSASFPTLRRRRGSDHCRRHHTRFYQ